jgi:hypothetical protein
MLGGSRSDGPVATPHVMATGHWRGSLAGRAERVEFGLLPEYTPAVVAAVGPSVAVSVAAHGPVSSSPPAFALIGEMLARLLRDGVDDGELLALWDDVRRRSAQQCEGGT